MKEGPLLLRFVNGVLVVVLYINQGVAVFLRYPAFCNPLQTTCTMSVTVDDIPRNDLQGPGELPLRLKSETVHSTPNGNTPLLNNPLAIPDTQAVLLLHAPRQPYELQDGYPIPPLQNDREVLVRNRAIGLNPMDWKAP